MMKQLMILMLVLMAGVSCPADSSASSKNKAGIDWDGQSYRNVMYKEVQGRKLLMDIYLPTGNKAEKAPAIYFVHGGGWAAGNKEKIGNKNTLPIFQQLSDKGFVCVSVGYRLCKKGRGIIMRDCVTDAMDGLRYLMKNAGEYGIDPNRIVVFGESAGGQIVQMLTMASPDGFKGDGELAAYGIQPIAGISWYGPTDFTDVNLFKTDFSDKNPNRFGARITGGKGDYTTNPAAYKEMSPYYWIKKNTPPILLLQGDTDATIPFAHAPHLKKKADSIGADVEMIIVKNAGHNWRKAGGNPEPGVEEIQRMTVEYALLQVELAEKKD